MNSSNPQVILGSSNSGSNTKNQFSVGIKEINEIDASAVAVRSISIHEINFTRSDIPSGANTIRNYSSTLSNSALLSVIVSFI